jgi:UDP-glucose-4-epimerase GalE
MQKILVTGGAGYIGSHICKRLYESGYDPITLDNLSTGFEKNVRWGKLYNISLESVADIEKIFKENEIKAVIHLAAKTFPRESIIKANEYYSSNVIGSINLLNAMKKFDVDKIIFSSSCSTYSTNEIGTISENHPTEPSHPYGKSKLIIESILKDYFESHGIASICFRYFNVAGSNNELIIGENLIDQDRIIPIIFNSLTSEHRSLYLYGDKHGTSDGTSVRDYIHVEDIASAHILAINKILAKEILFDTFNLGSGVGHSLLDVINTCSEITNSKIHYEFKSSNGYEPSNLIANITKAKSSLDWKPIESSLENIISSAWNWYQAQEIVNESKK